MKSEKRKGGTNVRLHACRHVNIISSRDMGGLIFFSFFFYICTTQYFQTSQNIYQNQFAIRSGFLGKFPSILPTYDSILESLIWGIMKEFNPKLVVLIFSSHLLWTDPRIKMQQNFHFHLLVINCTINYPKNHIWDLQIFKP